MTEDYDDGTYRPRLFIGGLKGPCQKDDLKFHFQEFGEIKDVWVAFNPPGFAFVEFTNMEAAKAAKAKMHLANILDTEIRVEMTKREKGDKTRSKVGDLGAKPRLFVGGLKNEVSPDQLKSLFEQEGPVTDVFIAEGKGYAFVEFASMAHAKNAKAKYDRQEHFGNVMRIDMSQKKSQGGQSGQSGQSGQGGQSGSRGGFRGRGRQAPYPVRTRGNYGRARRVPSYYDSYYDSHYDYTYDDPYYVPRAGRGGPHRPAARAPPTRGKAPHNSTYYDPYAPYNSSYDHHHHHQSGTDYSDYSAYTTATASSDTGDDSYGDYSYYSGH